MVVLGGWAVSYERGTPVAQEDVTGSLLQKARPLQGLDEQVSRILLLLLTRQLQIALGR